MTEGVFGLVGVIVGSLIVIIKDLWISRAERRRRAVYAAVRIISTLQFYVDRCVEVAADEGANYGHLEGGDDCFVATSQEPDVPQFAEDIDWTSLDGEVVFEVLSIADIARQAGRELAAAWEYVSPHDPGEFFCTRREKYAKLGLRSLEIIENLERKFHLAKPNLFGGEEKWFPREFFQKQLVKIEEQRNVLLEASVKFNQEMVGRSSAAIAGEAK